MNFLYFLATASNANGTAATGTAATDGAATGAAGALGSLGGIGQILIFVVPLGLMYLLLIMPQRKKEKKAKELVNSAIVGDSIVTIGGLRGKIVNIKDDEVTLESSIDRTKVTLKKWAIKEVTKALTDAS